MARNFVTLVVSLWIASASAVAASAQTVYQGPGSYSTYGNQTFGPGGIQSRYGNQVVTPQGTYRSYGNKTFGPGGTTYWTYGSRTYGSDGSSATTSGNQTYIAKPGQRPVVCSHNANQTYCD